MSSDTSTSIPTLVKAFVQAWADKDAEAMANLFTPEGIYEDRAFQTRFTGRTGVATWVKITKEHMPDLVGTVDYAIQSGDRIAMRWTLAATPIQLGRVPGTGKRFSVEAATILELSGDHISRATDFYNLADVLRQLGLPAGPHTPSAS